MKRLMLVVMIALVIVSAAMGQAKVSNDEKAKAQIIAMEKQSWQEWKNKNAAWFHTNLSDDFMSVHNSGVETKPQVVKSIAADCDVKSFLLDNYKFVLLNKDAALLTYSAKQDAVCSGNTIPANVLVAVAYVRRNGKWLQALYTETPAVQ